MYKVLLQKPLVNNLHRKNKLLIVILSKIYVDNVNIVLLVIIQKSIKCASPGYVIVMINFIVK